MTAALRIGSLVAPVVVAGLAHVVLLKLDVLPALAVPLDGGRTLGGRPLLGSNKTWRGALVMPLVSGLTMVLQGHMRRRSRALARFIAVELTGRRAFLAGAIYGLGYVLGELPNSFVKRRLDIAPGERRSWIQYAIDQLDSVIGCLLALRLFHRATRSELLGGGAMGAGIHVAIDAVLHLIGVKGSRDPLEDPYRQGGRTSSAGSTSLVLSRGARAGSLPNAAPCRSDRGDTSCGGPR